MGQLRDKMYEDLKLLGGGGGSKAPAFDAERNG